MFALFLVIHVLDCITTAFAIGLMGGSEMLPGVAWLIKTVGLLKALFLIKLPLAVILYFSLAQFKPNIKKKLIYGSGAVLIWNFGMILWALI